MADFAQWGEAVGLGLGWQPGTFVSAYNANRRAACIAELEDCPVAEALRRMMDGARGTYRGTASMLLEGLGSMTPAEITRSAQWPKTPRLFARILRRIAPQLRLIGINIRFDRRPNAREIKIWNVRDVERPAPGAQASTAPVPRDEPGTPCSTAMTQSMTQATPKGLT
jgi:hypothetical protein